MRIVNVGGAQIVPAGARNWGATGTYSFNPASTPTSKVGNVASVRKYNASTGNYTDIASPAASLLWANSSGYTPGQIVSVPGGLFRPLIEWGDVVQTITGSFEFSNDGSTVLATWEGTPEE